VRTSLACHGVAVVSVAVIGCTEAPAGPEPLHHLTVQLSADACRTYCVDEVTAELYRDGESLPIGPPIAVTCGEVVDFAGLPAGHRVRVRASASGVGAVRLAGWSELVTVPASGDATATVALESLIPPEVTAAEPEVVPPSVTSIRLTGRGLEGPEGTVGAHLGDSPVTVGAASDGALTLTLDHDANTGSELTVTVCGVASEPWPLRALDDTHRTLTVDAAICDAARVTGLVAMGRDLIAAVACASTGRLLRLTDGACLPTLFGPTLTARPTALTTAAPANPDAPAEFIVALDDGTLVAVSETTSSPLDWPVAVGPATRLATTEVGVVGVGPQGVGRLALASAQVVRLNDALLAVDVAGVAGGYAVLLSSATTAALRLERTGRATVDATLSACQAPSGLTSAQLGVDEAAPASLVVACESGLVLLDPESLAVTTLASPLSPGRPGATLGVLFALGEASLLGVAGATPYPLGPHGGATELAVLPDGRVAMASPTSSDAVVQVLAPFRGLPTCGVN
jgi:hypothetical protein